VRPSLDHERVEAAGAAVDGAAQPAGRVKDEGVAVAGGAGEVLNAGEAEERHAAQVARVRPGHVPVGIDARPDQRVRPWAAGEPDPARNRRHAGVDRKGDAVAVPRDRHPLGDVAERPGGEEDRRLVGLDDLEVGAGKAQQQGGVVEGLMEQAPSGSDPVFPLLQV
jgi:hypothetical protein